MVIKPPQDGASRPEMYMIENKNHFPKIKFPKHFLISRQNIFFWNLQYVYAWNFSNMNSPKSVPEVRQIGFSIPNEDWETSIIKNVSASGRDLVDEHLFIQVNITPKLDTVIVWDLKTDIEVDSYDVEPQSQIMFNSKGDMFLLDRDHVVINNSGGRCFAYQLEGNPYFNQWKEEKITNDF